METIQWRYSYVCVFVCRAFFRFIGMNVIRDRYECEWTWTEREKREEGEDQYQWIELTCVCACACVCHICMHVYCSEHDVVSGKEVRMNSKRDIKDRERTSTYVFIDALYIQFHCHYKCMCVVMIRIYLFGWWFIFGFLLFLFNLLVNMCIGRLFYCFLYYSHASAFLITHRKWSQQKKNTMTDYFCLISLFTARLIIFSFNSFLFLFFIPSFVMFVC